MPRQRYTRPPLDELRLGLMSTEGHEPLRSAGDGALVRLPDGTLGVVATLGQATTKLHVLTEHGTVRVDSDQVVQILAHPVLAAKLLIRLARTISALDQTDGTSLPPSLARVAQWSRAHLPPPRRDRGGVLVSGASSPHGNVSHKVLEVVRIAC